MPKLSSSPRHWLLFPLLMAAPAYANPSASIQFVETTTSDSHIEVKAQIPQEMAVEIWFQVKKSDGSGKADFHFANDGSPLDMDLYLEAGPGQYSAMLMTKTSPGENGTYNVIQNFALENTDTRDMSFLFPSSEVQSESPEIIALANQITAGLTDDFSKGQAIHDWVAKNVIYDMNQVLHPEPQSALKTLNTLKIGTVCEGYADLVAALGRAAGVRTQVIQGYGLVVLSGTYAEQALEKFASQPGVTPAAQPDGSTKYTSTPGGEIMVKLPDGTVDDFGAHMWNAFFANGKWIKEDATWDAGSYRIDLGKWIPEFSRKNFDPPAGSGFDQSHQDSRVADQ